MSSKNFSEVVVVVDIVVVPLWCRVDLFLRCFEVRFDRAKCIKLC